LVRLVLESVEDLALGRFLIYLMIMLSRMRLAVPDLGAYIDPAMSPLIVRES
jgi:hypothetical protein